MKICFISNDYPSQGRPVYVFVEQLVNALVELGCDVTVVAPQSLTKSLLRHLHILPVETDYLTATGKKYKVYRPYSFTFGNGKRILYKLADFFNQNSLNRIINSVSPDILYAHFWENALRVLPIAKKGGTPMFVACGEGDNAMEDMVKTLNKKELNYLKHAIKGVISVSSENKRKCIQYGIADDFNIIVLPNAVDNSLFYLRDKNKKLRQKLGVEEDDFLILYVGVFTPRKGASRLAKAIDGLRDNKIKVMFVGTAMPGVDEEPQCPGMVFKGSVNHTDLPDFFASSDAFVLPTLKEGCCNAIVESLAMGIPVISSDGAFNDDILNESNSIRVDSSDVEAIKEAIYTLKNDKHLYKRLVNSLRNDGKDYSIKRRAQEIMKFIESKV